jgi:hypothetical protein
MAGFAAFVVWDAVVAGAVVAGAVVASAKANAGVEMKVAAPRIKAVILRELVILNSLIKERTYLLKTVKLR